MNSKAWQWVDAKSLEPELAPGFDQGLWLKEEAHLDNRELLPALLDYVEEHANGSVCFAQDKTSEAERHKAKPSEELWIDCRGYEAADSLPELRAVRGEAALVHAPDVDLKRPIRMMHPRYAVYIVPRAQHMYYIGATSIESASPSPVTVRSILELLSAAYSVHKGFGEATIQHLLHGLRPALPHNRPEILVRPGHYQINGLYRHGFLLAPAIAQQVRWLLEDRSSLLKAQLFRFS